MNQKTCWVVLAIAASFAFSGLANAQSAPAPKKPKSSRAELIKRKIETQIQRVNDQISDADARIDANIETLRKQSVSDIGYEDVFRVLQIQKVELRIELQGLEARMKLLQEKVASTPDGQDEIAKTQRLILLRYVANQKKNVSRIKSLAKKGAVAAIDLSRSENLLAEAQLRLKEFDAKSKQASPKYVEALFETTLAIAERKAKLEAVEQLLEKHIASRSQINKLNELVETRDSERSRMRELIKEFDRFYQENAEAEF